MMVIPSEKKLHNIFMNLSWISHDGFPWLLTFPSLSLSLRCSTEPTLSGSWSRPRSTALSFTMERLSSPPSDLKMMMSLLFYKSQSRRLEELSTRCDRGTWTCSKLTGREEARSVFPGTAKLRTLRTPVTRSNKGLFKTGFIFWRIYIAFTTCKVININCMHNRW